ncbi:2'-5' RNA ligase family protein [uncultured Bosea sp.]|uniref:2'-5' RNA ligase family protein n=1 Tax=uncultured Bosea sp. TaxID=211457 RepID=UPI0025D39DBB|nr:2'-5' RNA ligase family protein [uncultured Bosea sp.]
MIGITLCTRSEAPPFWQWVDRASALEASSSIRALGYPPHLTLARYAGNSPDGLSGALAIVAEERPIALTFDRIGLFDVDPLVLWLSPRSDRHLIDLHARIHEIVGPALCDPYYRPGQWTPHLTLATAVPMERRENAVALTAESVAPFELVFDRVESVAWPPLQVLETVQLCS